MTSGRVSTSRSLSPRRSRAWPAKRSPRKSASVRLRRWIIVPIAPSRTRMRSRAAAGEGGQGCGHGSLSPCNAQCRMSSNSHSTSRRRSRGAVADACLRHRRSERTRAVTVSAWWRLSLPFRRSGFFAPAAISTVNGSPSSRAPTRTCTSRETGLLEQPRELLVLEAAHAVAEPVVHPRLVVAAQVEHQHAPAGPAGCARPRRARPAGARHGAAPARAARRPPTHPRAAATRARRASR